MTTVPKKQLTNANNNVYEEEVIEVTDNNEYSEKKEDGLSIIDPDNINPDEYNNMIDNNDSIKFKVMTWNLWCMIFAPRTLSNPRRCGKYVLNMAQKEDWTTFDGLIICSFQELWSWKTGIFPPFLLQLIAYFEYIPYLGVLISFLFQFITLLLGLLPILKCLPITYNPKKQISNILKKFVPYSYYNNNIPLRHVLDNGLLLLSNDEADKWGSFGFENHACDDSLAYKGFIYAYFKKHHCLIINTHLQAAGDGTARLSQIKELNVFINKFKHLIHKEMESMKFQDEYYRINLNKELKIIACGDWNVDMTNHDLIIKHENENENENKFTNSKDVQLKVDTENEKSIESNESRINSSRGSSLASIVSIASTSTTTSITDGGGIESEFTDIDMRGDDDDDASCSENKMKLDEDNNSSQIYRSKSYANLPNILSPDFGSQFIKVNGCDVTCKNEKWGCLDHILCNFEYTEFNEEILGKEDKLSDHLMVKNEFVSSHSNLKSIR